MDTFAWTGTPAGKASQAGRDGLFMDHDFVDVEAAVLETLRKMLAKVIGP
jgi:hypothetical protein